MIKSKDPFQFQTYMINQHLNYNQSNTMEIAERICFVRDQKYYAPTYKSLNEYCKCEFGLDRRRVAEFTKVVYKFCEKRKVFSETGTGYFVKSLFKHYSFSQLVLMTELKEEEIKKLGITSDLSVRKIRKIVRDYKKFLLGDAPEEETAAPEVEVNQDLNDYYKLDHAEMCFAFDKVYVNGKSKEFDLQHGLLYLRDLVLKDYDHDYMLVKINHQLEPFGSTKKRGVKE